MKQLEAQINSKSILWFLPSTSSGGRCIKTTWYTTQYKYAAATRLTMSLTTLHAHSVCHTHDHWPTSSWLRWWTRHESTLLLWHFGRDRWSGRWSPRAWMQRQRRTQSGRSSAERRRKQRVRLVSSAKQNCVSVLASPASCARYAKAQVCERPLCFLRVDVNKWRIQKRIRGEGGLKNKANKSFAR